MRATGLALLLGCSLLGCGNDEGTPPPDSGISTDNCTYLPVPATSHSGGTVTAAPLMAGAAERVLPIPVGTALGGYTGRAGFLSSAGTVDARKVAMSGAFNPSIGVTTAPKAKVLALTAGPETVVIVKVDMIFAYEGMVFDLEDRLGSDFHGKVILATSHTHSGWAQFSGHGPLKLGSGQLRDLVYKRMLDTFEATARDALAARQPAKFGVFADEHFDSTDQINRERRGENDMLPGGNRGEDHLYMMRVDATDGTPIAILPVFGEHGTLNDQDNPFASVDAPGAIERALEEQFDRKVVVMHIQSAGADTSPTPHGGLDCNNRPGKDSDPCFQWASEEGHGRAAISELMAAWNKAGTAMRDSLELEMLTRSVETGPYPETFTIRGGALKYGSFDGVTKPDGKVWSDPAAFVLASPVDEFNAPLGAGLCESENPMFPAAEIPGTEGILPYGSCLKLEVAAPILGPIFSVDFGVDDHHPVCETTRTTISALRIGDYVLGTLPGAVSVLRADLVRSKSPVAPDHTIVVGYAQGHTGYMLRPEDWMMGGYEPSVTFWGPLEAEYIAERLLDLMPLAMTPAREDSASDGATRLATAAIVDTYPIDDPAPMRGTVPSQIPAVTWARTGTPTAAQPAATIPRVAGIATFTFIGDDPETKTPHVTLQFEAVPNSGNFAAVTRRSGRVVDDSEVVIAYTPSPLQRSGPQTHMWVAEWQAVPWFGAINVDSLDARGGVPIGRYRFHVEGSGWTLDSSPFQVVQGGVRLTTAKRSGGNVQVTATWNAPKGWRLMDPVLMSNQPVPIRSQQVTVTLLANGGATLSSTQVTTDANGNAQIPDDIAAVNVKVTDRFGNSDTSPI